MTSTVSERIVDRMHITEDGSLSNKKIERFAIIMAEEVIAETAAWTIVMSSSKGNLPSHDYKRRIKKSPAFQARMETLMEEKARLQEDGSVWGQLEWQAKQGYRMAVARDDLSKMMQATEMLMKLAFRNEKASLPPKEESEKDSKGRGAPAVDMPLPADHVPNYRRAALVEKS